MAAFAGEDETKHTLLCMRHCTFDCNIFFLTFPANCPVCCAQLRNCSLIIPPFRVPSPFVSSQNAVCKVLLKPTNGSFFSYKNGENLHIGLSNSKGVVFNYDERGLVMDSEGWTECIVVDTSPVESQSTSIQHWNEVLQASSESGLWTTARYDIESSNCYDFVLYILHKLFPTDKVFSDKRSFSRNYIAPATKRAAQYISLYREILDKGFAVKSFMQDQ